MIMRISVNSNREFTLLVHFEIQNMLKNRTYLQFKFNPIQDGPFWCCSRMGVGKKSLLPKICSIYCSVMKLGTVIPYLKKIQKLYESRDTPLELC